MVSKKSDKNDPEKNKKRANQLRLALFGILIGGLVLSALISVSAILVGEFSEGIQKALFTTFVLVTHSLIVLGIISADKENHLFKSLVSTTILIVVTADMLTMTFGIWDLWGATTSWQWFSLYCIAIVTSFIAAGTLKLRLAEKVTTSLTYVTIGLTVILAALFIPWLFDNNSILASDIYYRLIGAFAILASTSLVITAIVNRIVVGQKPALAGSAPKTTHLSGGTIAINTIIGFIAGTIVLWGLANFIGQAAVSNQPAKPTYEYNYRYDR